MGVDISWLEKSASKKVVGLTLIRVGARVTGQVFKNESRRLAVTPNEHHAQLAYHTCGTVLSEGMVSSAVNF